MVSPISNHRSFCRVVHDDSTKTSAIFVWPSSPRYASTIPATDREAASMQPSRAAWRHHWPEQPSAVGTYRSHREILRLCTPGQTMVQTPGSAFWHTSQLKDLRVCQRPNDGSKAAKRRFKSHKPCPPPGGAMLCSRPNLGCAKSFAGQHSKAVVKAAKEQLKRYATPA